MSTPSSGPKPEPPRLMLVVGGPAVGDSVSPGVTTNEPELVAVPLGVVIETGPVDAVGGTVAPSDVPVFDDTTASVPLNRTLPLVRSEPRMVTGVPAGP